MLLFPSPLVACLDYVFLFCSLSNFLSALSLAVKIILVSCKVMFHTQCAPLQRIAFSQPDFFGTFLNVNPNRPEYLVLHLTCNPSHQDLLLLVHFMQFFKHLCKLRIFRFIGLPCPSVWMLAIYEIWSASTYVFLTAK